MTKTMTIVLVLAIVAFTACSPYAGNEGSATGNLQRQAVGEVFEPASAERLVAETGKARVSRRVSDECRTGRGESRDGHRRGGGHPGRGGLRWLLDENGEPLSDSAFAERLNQAVAEGLITEERRERLINRRASGDHRRTDRDEFRGRGRGRGGRAS
ncbi:MAG: hypothetical protein FWB79_05075 [Treponema sp.]|nr:hypothetical protein [Treponema sp.]